MPPAFQIDGLSPEGCFSCVFASSLAVLEFALTLAALAPLVSSASAQEATPEAPGDDAAIDLDAITVTATKAGERVYDSSVAIERHWSRAGRNADPAEQHGRCLTADPQCDDPVCSGRSGHRVNVRGLQDFGRVNVLVDGARQNFQREGHSAKEPSTSTRR